MPRIHKWLFTFLLSYSVIAGASAGSDTPSVVSPESGGGEVRSSASIARAAGGYDTLFTGHLAGRTGIGLEAQNLITCQRQIATMELSGNPVHVVWSGPEWAVPHCFEAGAEYAAWNSGSGSWQPPWCDLAGCVGYPGTSISIDLRDSGEPVVAFNVFPEGSYYYDDFAPCPGLPYPLPTPLAKFQDSIPCFYPRLAIHRGGSGTSLRQVSATSNVYHVFANALSGNHNAGLIYYRYDDSSKIWAMPVFIDSAEQYSHFVAVDRGSDRVVVAYCRSRVPGSPDLDLVYRESWDRGLSWLSSGGGTVYNITQSRPSSPERAVGDLSGGFSIDGRLHLIWVSAYDTSPGSVDPRCNLRHWVEDVPGSNGPLGWTNSIVVVAALWVPYGKVGQHNLDVCRLSLGFGDGSTQCTYYGAAETNQEYLYAAYTQFGSRDVADLEDTSWAGYQNGNVFLSISRDGGQHWTGGICITSRDSLGGTPSRSPGCDAFTPCLSENWSSLAELVNDTLHLGYVADPEAGNSGLGEGSWNWGYYMYVRIPGGPNGDLCLHCTGVGDMNRDGVLDVFDVIGLIELVFEDAAFPAPIPWCDTPRGDLNCDREWDVFDVIKLIGVVFMGEESPCP